MTKRIGSIYAIVFELNLVKVNPYGKKWSWRILGFKFNYMFLTSEKRSFGVHTDRSPKMCTHVEQIFLYKAGLLLNIDVAVPFLKRKNISQNCVSIQCTPHCQGVSVSPTNQMPAFILIDSPQYPTRDTRRQWLANVPHKCTLVRSFCKVNNFELMNNFSHRCTASNLQISNAFLNIFHSFYFK